MVHGVVGCYWFIQDSSFDVGPVTIHSFTELLLCFSDILDVASATYKVGCCASCMCFDVVCFACQSAGE